MDYRKSHHQQHSAGPTPSKLPTESEFEFDSKLPSLYAAEAPWNVYETRGSVVSKRHDILADAGGVIDPAIYDIITIRDRRLPSIGAIVDGPHLPTDILQPLDINRIHDERRPLFPSIINGIISDRRSSTYG